MPVLAPQAVRLTSRPDYHVSLRDSLRAAQPVPLPRLCPRRDRHARARHRREHGDLQRRARRDARRCRTATAIACMYLRQSTNGPGGEDIAFSVPEINDFRERRRRSAASPSIRRYTFTLLRAIIEPNARSVGLVTGNYFSVMGLSPVVGRASPARTMDAPPRP